MVQLANKSREKEAPTFREVYESERDYLWRVVLHLGIPRRYAEDVTHDIFVVVHRQLPQYDPTRPIKPWLFGIASRVASDFRRKASNRSELLTEADPPAGEPTMEHHVAKKQARRFVLKALEGLSPDQRDVFVLHDIEEQPVPAIAEALGIPLNTAYSRLRLARAGFERAIKRLLSKEAQS